MKTVVHRLFLCLFVIGLSCSSDEGIVRNATNVEGSSVYFPPLNSEIWETTAPETLGWNTNHLTPLLTFLEQQNTKSFIILHNGRIVVEHYFNNHSATANWYWASAGKTLTTTLYGIAQDEGLINIDHKVSTYIGDGWTSAPPRKEALILCKNLLSMNSGPDDTLGDSVAPRKSAISCRCWNTLGVPQCLC
ncbi:serine hydrolase [Lacinutrix neustonica]|uniref:serine hydrolase n=1 Tax=Lacinutrix neustonica TaxID=2980107 RepID=UPI0028BEDE1D|nr:serine hydrolase [Lacinutrix neustonica]